MRKQTTKDGGSEETQKFSMPYLANGAMTQAVSRAGEIWTRACLEWQEELARFASSQIESHLEHARSLAQCQNVIDLVKLQQKWAAATMRDYGEETGQLMQIATRAMQGATSSEPHKEEPAA